MLVAGSVEVDACASSPCGAGANCTSVDGAAVCACPPGYTGPPHEECLDLNECGRPNACGVNAKCINSVGNYTCTCPPGFSGQGQQYCESTSSSLLTPLTTACATQRTPPRHALPRHACFNAVYTPLADNACPSCQPGL